MVQPSLLKLAPDAVRATPDAAAEAAATADVVEVTSTNQVTYPLMVHLLAIIAGKILRSTSLAFVPSRMLQELLEYELERKLSAAAGLQRLLGVLQPNRRPLERLRRRSRLLPHLMRQPTEAAAVVRTLGLIQT